MTKKDVENYLHDYRGDLLDLQCQAAINERENTSANKQLAKVNEQIRLIENITDEAQRDYFSSVDLRIANVRAVYGRKVTASAEWLKRHA